MEITLSDLNNVHIYNPWSSLILIKKYNIPYDVELWISDLEPEKEKLVWWEKNFFPIQFQSKLIDCFNEFFFTVMMMMMMVMEIKNVMFT